MIKNLPFDLEFRKRLVSWSLSAIHVVGWARKKNGADNEHVAAVVEGNGHRSRLRYPRSKFPIGERANIRIETYTDQDVERVFSGFQPLVLWPTQRIFSASVSERGQVADPWQMRDEFLRVQSNGEEFLAFLTKWGQWGHDEFLEVSELTALQSAVREALLSSSDSWFQSHPASTPIRQPKPGFPYFGMRTNMARVALQMTVTLDLVGQIKFKSCARPDCRQPFAESRRDRKFCSKECGHVEVVRRSRESGVVMESKA